MSERPPLKVTPEVVSEYIPRQRASDIIRNAARSVGKLENYDNYLYGSGWYVELPYYVDYLLCHDREEVAKEIVRISFEQGMIPQFDYNEMVRVRKLGL